MLNINSIHPISKENQKIKIHLRFMKKKNILLQRKNSMVTIILMVYLNQEIIIKNRRIHFKERMILKEKVLLGLTMRGKT